MNTLVVDQGLSSLRVLVIDDEVSVLKLICAMLDQIGVTRVQSSSDPARALDMFRQKSGQVDVVLCDWNMPGLSGLEMLTIVNGLNPDVAFLMVTGSAELSQVIEAKEHGVSGYIKKPFSSEELRKKLLVVARVAAHRRKRP